MSATSSDRSHIPDGGPLVNCLGTCLVAHIATTAAPLASPDATIAAARRDGPRRPKTSPAHAIAGGLHDVVLGRCPSAGGIRSCERHQEAAPAPATLCRVLFSSSCEAPYKCQLRPVLVAIRTNGGARRPQVSLARTSFTRDEGLDDDRETS